jgi:hypothetical protein
MYIANLMTDILTKRYTLTEFILHISFILIIFLIIYIFYWHYINRKVAKINRCKISLKNNADIYTINANYQQSKLYKVDYNSKDSKDITIECTCPTGNVPNKFEIPVYDSVLKETTKYDKYCVCDQNYVSDVANSKDITYDGDEFLVDYYSNYYNDNTIKMEFPNT